MYILMIFSEISTSPKSYLHFRVGVAKAAFELLAEDGRSSFLSSRSQNVHIPDICHRLGLYNKQILSGVNLFLF